MSKNSKISKVVLGISFALIFAISSTASAAITSFLKYGSRGAEVKELQMFLNNCSAETMVASTGAGSAGYETTYFGPATNAAVKAFQSKMGLVADGLVGKNTRAAISSGCGGSMNNNGGNLPADCAGNMYSPSTGVKCDGSGSGSSQSGPVSAMFSGMPGSTTFVNGQATANLADFAFSGTGVVTNVTLQRIGVSSDSTLSNVYLFDGATRLTDAASVTNGGMITFSNPAGLFTVGGSKTISVKSDIAGSTAGQVVGVKLVSFMASGSSASTVNLSGNLHSIANATLAAVSAGTVTPSGSTINPGPAQTLWQSTLSVTQRDVWMKRLALRQVGSAPASALQNFKLYVNGDQIGSTVASLDVNGYVTFDLMSNPVLLKAGSRVVRVEADVVSGSSRTIQLSLRQAADVDFVDYDYGVNITPTSTPWSASSALTIAGSSGGSLTIQKDTTLSSGDITDAATDVTIGRFTYQAFGEAMKIETIKAAFYSSDTSIDSLRNGRVLINGVQYGSTATLVTCDTDSDGDCDGSDTSGTGTSYTVNYTIPAGQTVTIEVHADVYDNDGTNNVSANDTIIAAIAVGSNNVQKIDSLGYASAPSAVTLGQTMTVKSATATLTKSGSYGNQTTNIPQTGYILGSWNISAGSAEDLNINTVSLDFTAVSGSTFTYADLTNVYVKVGSVSSSTYSSVAASSNTFSLPSGVTVPKGTSVSVMVYGNILSGGITATDSIKATATISGTSAVSGTSVTTSAVDGQTIAYNTGSFAIALDGASPVNRAVSGNQEVTAAVYKFTATNDTYTIKEVDVSVPSQTAASAIVSASIYDGTTLLGSLSVNGSDADSGSNNMFSFTGLSLPVNNNTTKTLTVKFMLNNIGNGYGSSQQNVKAQIDRVRYQDSAGSVTNHTTDYDANELYVYKAVPTITIQSVDTTTKLVNGSQRDLYKFNVTAPSSSVSPNGVTLKQVRLALTWNDGTGAADALEIEQVKVLVDGSDITGSDVTIQDQSGNTAESTSGVTEADTYLVISWDAGKELAIGAGQTRTVTVRGIPQGFNVTDGATTPIDSVGFQLQTDSSHNSTKLYLNGISGAATVWGLHTSAAATGSGTAYNLIWSDTSAAPHATAENASSSGDWANGYKIFDDLGLAQFSD